MIYVVCVLALSGGCCLLLVIFTFTLGKPLKESYFSSGPTTKAGVGGGKGPTTKDLKKKKIFTYFSQIIVEKNFFGQNPCPAILRRKKN